MPAPIERAKIVDDRELRGGGEVGQAQPCPGDPAAMIEQIVKIVEVAVGDLHCFAQHAGVGGFLADQALAHAFVHQRLDHLAKQLVVEPLGEAADFGAGGGVAVQHGRLVDGLVEIFDDRLAADQRQAEVGFDQHRGLARRIEVDELVAPLPRIFAHQFMRDALFAKHEPDLAREGAQRELEQLPHGGTLRA